jgi:3D (Asp-Asp-Asp) domain-containing protein
MAKFAPDLKSWKDTFALGAIPAVLLLLVNLYFESQVSIQSLMAGYEGHNVLTRLPEAESVLVSGIVEEDSQENIQKEAPLGESFVYQKTIIAKVTGYTPGEESCGIYADGVTSIGKNAWSLWGVAADPTALPYGTLIYIPGVGYREVDDTGSAMRDAWRKDKKFHIDLRFDNVKEARQWGVRQLKVHVFMPEQP